MAGGYLDGRRARCQVGLGGQLGRQRTFPGTPVYDNAARWDNLLRRAAHRMILWKAMSVVELQSRWWACRRYSMSSEGGWAVQVRARRATAHRRHPEPLLRLDDNAYAWRSIAANGWQHRSSDSDEMVWTRHRPLINVATFALLNTHYLHICGKKHIWSEKSLLRQLW